MTGRATTPVRLHHAALKQTPKTAGLFTCCERETKMLITLKMSREGQGNPISPNCVQETSRRATPCGVPYLAIMSNLERLLRGDKVYGYLVNSTISCIMLTAL